MSVSIERLFMNARLRLPGAMEEVLKQELFMVLDEFFRTTNLWHEEMRFTAVKGQNTYSFAPVIGIWTTESDIGFRAAMFKPGDVYLLHSPNSTVPMTADMILTVDDPVDHDGFAQFPEAILQNYHATILDGLLGRMMSQPAKPYTSEKLSIYHMRRYRNGLAIARVDGEHANVKGAQRWRFPAYGG